MKKLLMIGLVMMAGSSVAQKVSLANEQCDNLSVSLDETYYTIPAKFPKASSTEKIKAPYIITCPNFIAERTKEGIQISSKSWESINKIFSKSDIFKRVGYKYPAIKEGFYSNNVHIQFFPTEIVYKNWISLATIGYKINNGELKPLYFEFEKYPIDYKVGDLIDIYAKDDYMIGEQVLARITINTKSPSVKIWTEYPFPEN